MANWTPESRIEEILFDTINGEEYNGLPESRVEELLLELKEVIEAGGGGGGGTTNYNLLQNKPQINDVTLTGNKSLSDLGIIQEIKKVMDMITGTFDTTVDYEKGDLVIYDKKLYEFEVDHAAGEWSNLEVNQVAIADLLGSGSGDASLETAVTSNLAVGAIASGTTLAKGTTFTEFVQKLLISEIAPTTTFTASGSGVKEIGTSVTPTLTLVVNTVGTGTPTAIKFYSGSTLLDTQDYVSGTNTYSFTMTDAITTNTTVKGVLEYKKSDDTSATIEKSASYTFVMASYYGAVTTAPTDKAGIIALTKNVKNTKALTAAFNLSNQRSCYCYPASFGNLTSIKDANNFEYLSSYTKTNVTVDEVSYNVYTLTDPVTATGFKQVYA